MEKGAIIKHDIKNAPKTGNWRYMKPEVDEQKCIGCQTCVEHCPEACIDIKNQNAKCKMQNGNTDANLKEKKIAKIDFEFCKGCGVCARVCPVKAIIMKK